VPIVNDGEPAIVMINSRTCGYCKMALRDLGAYANGRDASRLRMLTLEGAADGVPMLRDANIVGAVPLGPATSQTQVLLTFRYRGTPTFVAVDADGRIRGTMPGYPGPERLASWFDVMLGDRPAPLPAN
jgi:thioredoxin-related protein